MRYIYLVVSIAVAIFITSCQEEKKGHFPTIFAEDSLAGDGTADSTIYGKYLEGGMSTLTILNETGDTLTFLLETTDTVSVVHGGLFPGDKMAIIAQKTADGDLFAEKVINTTSLIGRWTSIAKNFEIEAGGAVHSTMPSESNPYTSWKIHNGRLILNADTFDIYRLGPDTLSLENAKGIFDYKRQ